MLRKASRSVSCAFMVAWAFAIGCSTEERKGRVDAPGQVPTGGAPLDNWGTGGSNGFEFVGSGATSVGGADRATGGMGAADGTGATAGGDSATGGQVTGTGGAILDPNRATFRNPLNTSHGSDPWMIYFEGEYYLAATTWGDSLTMKHGPTVSALKSAQPEVIWQDDNQARCCNMWAPEFFLLEGPNGLRWYHYYTAGDGNDLGTQRSYVLESEGRDPMGPYHFKGQLIDYWAIDGSILKYDGMMYFLFSAWDGPTQNVYIQQMENPWTLVGARTMLTAPTYAWEQEGSDSVNEGPEILQHKGRVFLTYSASQCADAGYKLGLLEFVGADPMNESAWSKSNMPVFEQAEGIYGPGHNGFFVSPDGLQNWLVYHATTNESGSCWTDRTTRIQPFDWNMDGTPHFGAPLPLESEILVPSGE